jgi:hypothetical protein
MLHLYDRATTAHALTLDLDPLLRALLEKWLVHTLTADSDLSDDTEYLIVEQGDTEADVIRHINFSPMIEPIDGRRYGTSGFHPFWDRLEHNAGWYEMVVTFGSAFALILLISDTNDACPDLVALCGQYAREQKG